MPYRVQSARSNRTVIVAINKGGEEQTVQLRDGAVAYSTTLTADLRHQAHLRYITCKFVKEMSDIVVDDPPELEDDDIDPLELGESDNV